MKVFFIALLLILSKFNITVSIGEDTINHSGIDQSAVNSDDPYYESYLDSNIRFTDTIRHNSTNELLLIGTLGRKN